MQEKSVAFYEPLQILNYIKGQKYTQNWCIKFSPKGLKSEEIG